MRRSWHALARVLVVAGLVVLVSGRASAQAGGTTATLSGSVTDTSNGVIPGADVVAKNNATSARSRAVTDGGGRFTIPALNPGTYTVTVSLMGFKTWSSPDVQIVAATPASLKAVLEMGRLEETVIVEGAAELVQTQTASVQQTIAVEQIEALPLVTRTALDFVTALPSVQTAGSGSRGTIINGLPGVTINITLDGVNVQDNNNRGNVGGQNGGDGFFMYIRPMLDSVEEITVSSSTPGAESAGQGASQIRMVTRSGSNRFTASVYDTWRNQAGTNDDDVMTRKQKRGWLWRLNTPYWFNRRDLPRTAAGDDFITDVRVQTPGFRVGGPILRDRAFYFFNWEWFKWPNQISRTRYLLNESAMSGLFTYPAANGSGNRTVDLLALAARNGQTSTTDPILGRLLGDIRSAADGAAGGSVSKWDLNTDKLDYSPGGIQNRHFPTLRLDVNLAQNHRVTLTGRYNRFESTPDLLNGRDPNFPGFANTGGQFSDRYMAQGTLRSTVGKNVVNEARVGWSGGTTEFFPEITASQFTCTGAGCQGGYDLRMDLNVGSNALTRATTSAYPSSRYVPDLVFEDTLTWLRGRHTVNTGVSYTQIKFENWDWPNGVVPSITLGVNSLDPAYNLFSNASTNFSGGISTIYETYARNLYAILTGRVTALNGTAAQSADGRYTFQGDRWQKGRQNTIGLFVSDAWRLTPTITLNGGLRYELQLPFQPDLGTWATPATWADVYGISGEAGMFEPGTLAGRQPTFARFDKGDKAYRTDVNNLAPSVGIAWRAHVANDFLARILSRDPVFRGGYSIAYTRYGTGDFADVYGRNPGSSRDVTRSIALGNLGTDGLPVLLRDAARLAPPAMPGAPSYPSLPAVSETVAVMDPNLRVPYTHQYSFGWQRALGKRMAMELRYVGNRMVGQWTTASLNAVGNRFLIENGFIEEFKKAQANLAANVAAGRGNTFAYTGAGTSPLPIFLAHFSGLPASAAGDPSKYTAQQFSAPAFYNSLAAYNPRIDTITGTGTSGLQYATFRANMLKAGLPSNFWVANPDVAQGDARITYNGGNTRYDGLQFDMRRRMSGGLLLAGSYAYGRSLTWSRPTLRNGFVEQLSTWNLDHAFKLNWVFELPFGQGKTFGGGATGWKHALIGGWEWDGAVRIQSGQVVNFYNANNADTMKSYRLVGMTEKEFQKMFKLYKQKDSSGKERIYMLPQDVILNSIAALTTASATSPTGYSGTPPAGRFIAPASYPGCVQAYDGQCAPLNHFVRGPWVKRTDFAFVKRIDVMKGKKIELRMDLFNVFDTINFIPRAGLGSAPSGWEVIGAFQDINASQDAGGRMTQFGLRFTW